MNFNKKKFIRNAKAQELKIKYLKLNKMRLNALLKLQKIMKKKFQKIEK